MKLFSIVAQLPDYSVRRADYRYIGLTESGNLLQVVLLLPNDPVRTIATRSRMARRYFIRSLAKMSPTNKTLRVDRVCFAFDMAAGENDMLEVFRRLDQRLTDIFEAPLPAKLVDGLLGITASERRRWSKDGRLPPCGSRASTRSNTRFHLPVFKVDLIQRLREDPQLIAWWRSEDNFSPSDFRMPSLEQNASYPDVKI